MKHAMVLLWAIVFGFGITAIATTLVRGHQERLGLLRRYSRFLVLWNVAVGGLLAMTYVATNLTDVMPGIAGRSAAAPFLAASFWLVAAFVFEIVIMTAHLVGREASRRTRRRVATVLAAAPLGLLAGLALSGSDLSDEDVLGYSEMLNVSLVVGGMIVMSGWLFAARSLVSAAYRLSVRWFCALHLAAFGLVAAAAGLVHPAVWFVLIAAFLIVNLTPLVLVEPLLLHRRASLAADPARDEALERFAHRHRISRREREIVGLLLDGRTNSQIGDALCISIHTVKNHVYSVYRKAAVTNRVQLANLVRGR